MKMHLEMYMPCAPNRHSLPVGSPNVLYTKPNPSWDEDGKPRILISPVEPILRSLASER